MRKYDDVNYHEKKYDQYEEDYYYNDRRRRRRNRYEDKPLHNDDYREYKSNSRISGGEIAICIILFLLGFWPGIIYLLYLLYKHR